MASWLSSCSTAIRLGQYAASTGSFHQRRSSTIPLSASEPVSAFRPASRMTSVPEYASAAPALTDSTSTPSTAIRTVSVDGVASYTTRTWCCWPSRMSVVVLYVAAAILASTVPAAFDAYTAQFRVPPLLADAMHRAAAVLSLSLTQAATDRPPSVLIG